ncbi:MAG: hypothetical protein VKL39_09505 [Leptolyngbyaceae bacterium]|nr:hypothetical protein [Leptolyngbyaceae bacterium]
MTFAVLLKQSKCKAPVQKEKGVMGAIAPSKPDHSQTYSTPL